MAQTMTAERVAREKKDVGGQDNRAQSDAEAVRKPEAFPRIVRQKDQKNKREIQKITMNILQNQRKFSFAPVAAPRFADRARRRVCPERLVIRAAIVVTGKSESAGRP